MPNTMPNLWEQYNTDLSLEGASSLAAKYDHVIVCGMGGSHLAATLIAADRPHWIIHHDYGLPALSPKTLAKSLVVLVSYSGNTEEVLDSFDTARKHDADCVIITTGGQLLREAKLHDTPHVIMPSSDLQPRDALGYQLRALRAATRDGDLPSTLSVPEPGQLDEFMIRAHALADHFAGSIGLIYGTQATRGLAYIWKITLNETGKTPAHYNLLPELNHNELESYGSSPLAKEYAGLTLSSLTDHERIQKRATITTSLLNQFFPMHHQSLSDTKLATLFREVYVAMHTAKRLAIKRDLDPAQVPTIEQFKKNMLR